MATSTMSKTKVETGAPVSGTPTMMDKLSNYIIVDIGANLTNKKFSRDLDQVIQRATDAGEELKNLEVFEQINVQECRK